MLPHPSGPRVAENTLASLIAKFYLPEEGAVLLDGIDTRQLSSPWLHGHLGIVPQQNHLFGGTILDNIRVVRPEPPRRMPVRPCSAWIVWTPSKRARRPSCRGRRAWIRPVIGTAATRVFCPGSA